MPRCSESKCNKPIQARGLCSLHYQRYRRKHGGSFYTSIKVRNKLFPTAYTNECAIDHCTRKTRSFGLCPRHYLALNRYRKQKGKFCRKCDGGVVMYARNLCYNHFVQEYGKTPQRYILTDAEWKHFDDKFDKQKDKVNHMIQGY